MLAYYEKNENPYRIFQSRGFDFPLHMHREIELIYVSEGRAQILCGDSEYTLGAGECGLIFPNRIHGYETKEASEGMLLIVNLDLVPEFEDEFRGYSCEDPVVRKDRLHQDVIYCLNRLHEERKLNDRPEITKGFLSVLFGRLLEVMPLKPVQYSEPADLMHQMLLYINDNYKEPLTLEAVAKALGASKYHLSRIFTKKINCGFNEYVNTLRIGYVKQQLRKNGRNISDIAFESGFENLHTFNRVFLELCGTTPSKYRAGHSHSCFADGV